MSQSGVINNSVMPPGAGVQTLTGDTGGAVGPDGANNINLLTGVGVTSAGNAGTNTITFSLDNTNEGTGTTIGAVTADLITIALGATPTTYTIECRVAGFEATTPAGAGYQIIAMVRTTGAAASLIGATEIVANENVALSACIGDIVVSGNNAIVRVTGTAGLTVNWRAFSLYTRVA